MRINNIIKSLYLYFIVFVILLLVAIVDSLSIIDIVLAIAFVIGLILIAKIFIPNIKEIIGKDDDTEWKI